MLLTTTNLSFSYTTSPFLRDISLSLPSATLTTLLGPNGSGKSTLLKLLLNHLKPFTGQITWFNLPINKWSRRSFAQKVAYLPQSPTANPSDTVLSTLRLGRSPHLPALGLETSQDLKIIQDTANLLSLTDLLQKPLSHLSGGQRQRVFLARALIQQPAALLLDEPTTFLDLKHQLDLMQLLRHLVTTTGLTVLLSTHDLTLASHFSDQSLLLHQGSPATPPGPPSTVLTPSLLSTVYQTPMTQLGPYLLPLLPSPASSNTQP